MQNHEDCYYQKQSNYPMLADYIKYSDPLKHLYHNQKHYHYLCKWMMYQEKFISEHQLNEYSKARFFHTSPNTPAVDIYLNNEPILKNIRFKNRTDYIELPEGSYHIDIYPAEGKNAPILSKMLKIEGRKPFTVAVIGFANNLRLLSIVDDPNVPISETKMRVWHLSPDGPPFDIAIKKGDVVFSNVHFSDVTKFLSMTPMTVDLEIRAAGTKDVVLSLNRVNLRPNAAYTIIAAGLFKTKNGIEAVYLIP